MRRAEAWEAVGGLGAVSKMPGPSYGLPIAACGVGAVLRARDPSSVCARCYAARYRPSVLTSQERRLAKVREALSDPEAADCYVEAFAVLLRRVRWFRWFDSGDLQGASHLALIARIARATPRTRH